MDVHVQSGDHICVECDYGEVVSLPLTVNVNINIEERPLYDRDIRDELATSLDPTNPPRWWVRSLNQIDTLTFHHTLSDSPHVTFKNYILSRNRPTGPYTFWITQDGQILLCVDPELGNWHDHTGFYVTQNKRRLWGNRHLSVGLAGRLHEYMPAEIQLDAAARFAANVIESTEYSGIASITDIKGHMDMIGTECPGWVVVRNGKQCEDRWKIRLYDMIRGRLV